MDKITETLIELAIEEDVGSGDVTSQAMISEGSSGDARVVAKEDLVVCGQHVAASVCRRVSRDLRYYSIAKDGDFVLAGAVVARIEGPYRAILASERTCLNFLQRLSGIASRARDLAEVAKPFGVSILDTRKTTPGWRSLEKYAVATGGACNHRLGLYDAVLIKDNHIDAFGGGLADAVVRCRRFAPAGMRVQIEVRSMEELADAVNGYPDAIMLDNMSPAMVKECVDFIREKEGSRKIELEVSGGITADNLEDYLRCGADFISLGALTHSVRAADLALYYGDQ